jgi:hypothetical protein
LEAEKLFAQPSGWLKEEGIRKKIEIPERGFKEVASSLVRLLPPSL